MVEYRFEAERKLLVVTVSGTVTDEDFQDDKFPDLPEGTLELLDLTRAEAARISNAEIRRLAEVDKKRPDRVARMAILADRDVGFGLARMYQTLTSGMQTVVEVFRSREEALAWLGIDD